jgi:parallel beta-helix repeat protein
MRKRIASIVAVLGLLVASDALAVDGVIEINQARALAGGVTPLDAPGFPVQIHQPGSYRLTGNLVVPDANTSAITVHYNGSFDLDLNGFEIRGPGLCFGSCPATSCASGSGVGVEAQNGWTSVSISNGVIRGMGAEGVWTQGAVSLEDVVIRENGGGGVNSHPSSDHIEEVSIASITRTQILSNGGMGLRSLGSAKLTDSKVSCNVGGIEVGFNSSVVGNIVEDNGTGIFANGGSTVSDNISRNNGGAGISVAAGSKVTRNVVSNSAREGIYAIDGSTVEGNTVSDSAMSGIVVTGSKGAVFGNFLAGNGASVSAGKALDLGSQVAFTNNVLSNHGDAECEAVRGGVEMGHNTCDGAVSCTMAYCPFPDPVCGSCIR